MSGGSYANAPFFSSGSFSAGGVLRQRQNAGTVKATGIELDAAHVFGRVIVTAAASWTEATMDGGATAPQLTAEWSSDDVSRAVHARRRSTHVIRNRVLG